MTATELSELVDRLANHRTLGAAPRQDLAWLAAHGYHPIRLATLFRALEYGRPLPPRPVVLSFDDGYVDDVATVAPLLRRRGWPAAFFVITGRAGARAFVTWPQIRALRVARRPPTAISISFATASPIGRNSHVGSARVLFSWLKEASNGHGRPLGTKRLT